MKIEIDFTDELTNTQYAPLAAIFVHYQTNHVLKGLDQLQIPMKTRDFSAADKLTQILLSILAGCETLSEVNSKLKSEAPLSRPKGLHFTHRSGPQSAG